MRFRIITILLLLIVLTKSHSLYSQNAGLLLRLNNIYFSGAKEEAFFEDRDILGNPMEDSNVSSLNIDFSYIFKLRRKYLISRIGYGLHSSNNRLDLFSSDASVVNKTSSKNETWSIQIGLLHSVEMMKKVDWSFFYELLFRFRNFEDSKFENVFYNDLKEKIGESGAIFKKPPTWNIGISIGNSLLYKLNSKIGVGLEFAIPVYVILKNGISTRINYTEDIAGIYEEVKSFHDESDWILAKSVYFSIGIKYYLNH